MLYAGCLRGSMGSDPGQWGQTPLKLLKLRNVAAISVLLFGLAGIVLMFWSPLHDENGPLFEHWKYLTPLITASLGYLFGQMRTSKTEES